MALFAMSVPILAGKTEQWQRFAAELKGPRKTEFDTSRRALGIHERTFLQKTPQGDFVIVTIEGKDPTAAFAAFGRGTDEFTKWFVDQAKQIHGMDLAAPQAGPLPELIIESVA